MASLPWQYVRVRTVQIDAKKLRTLRGTRSREVIAHRLRARGHGTDAKSIWRYETGRSRPGARILADYAEVLGAKSLDDLYADDSEEEMLMVLLQHAREAESALTGIREELEARRPA